MVWRRLQNIALFGFVLGFLGSCTLHSLPPSVQIKVEIPARAQESVRQGARPGPPLSDMKCFGVVVQGASPVVTSSQVATRSPSCLALQGAFFGPFSYSQMITGVSLTVPTGNYQFSVTGFTGISSCGGSLQDLFRSALVETYQVVSPVAADTAATSRIVLNAGSYLLGNATNLTPLCPPASGSCAGAAYCDRFIDNGVIIYSHVMDLGRGWVGNSGSGPTINNNEFLIPVSGNGLASPALYVTDTFFSFGAITIEGRLGVTLGSSSIGMTFQYVDAMNFRFGTLTRNNTSNQCKLEIGQLNSGVVSILATTYLNFPTDCPTDTYLPLTFTASPTGYTLAYGIRSASYLVDTPGGDGLQSGFIAAKTTTLIENPAIRFFRFDSDHR